VANAANYWETSHGTSRNILLQGERTEAQDTVEIKGYMTLKEISGVTRISPERLLQLGNLPEDTPVDMKIKDLEKCCKACNVKVYLQ
jgi:hypothetical protein